MSPSIHTTHTLSWHGHLDEEREESTVRMAQLAFTKILMRPNFTPSLTQPKALLQRLLAEPRAQMPHENMRKSRCQERQIKLAPMWAMLLISWESLPVHMRMSQLTVQPSIFPTSFQKDGERILANYSLCLILDPQSLGIGGNKGLHNSFINGSISRVHSLVPTPEIAILQYDQCFSAPFNA